MDQINLTPMTLELARQFYREFKLDPDLFEDKAKYVPFSYSNEFSDNRVRRYAEMGRVFMAVMLGRKPIGEIVLKNIDVEQKTCELGITMINDTYKNRGYGTAAEKLILKYAFKEMGMQTVFADALIGNTRSQHVLEKVGFVRISEDEHFIYYRFDYPCDPNLLRI